MNKGFVVLIVVAVLALMLFSFNDGTPSTEAAAKKEACDASNPLEFLQGLINQDEGCLGAATGAQQVFYTYNAGTVTDAATPVPAVGVTEDKSTAYSESPTKTLSIEHVHGGDVVKTMTVQVGDTAILNVVFMDADGPDTIRVLDGDTTLLETDYK